MQQSPFDATAALAAIRDARAARRHRRTWGQSRLARHRVELVQLRQAGASYGDLVHWLRREKRTKVSRSTVLRYLAKLPELGSV